jgi:hypothetical protein
MQPNIEESIAFTLRQKRIRPTELNKNLMFNKITKMLPHMEMSTMDRQAYDSLETNIWNEYFIAKKKAFDSLIEIGG